MSVLVGPAGRRYGQASGIEVSLLGAALCLQAQRFVAIAELCPRPRRADCTADGLTELAHAQDERERLDPYYRAYACASGGFVALACLNAAQRRTLARLRSR